MPLERPLPDAAHNPLPHIAAKMQQQVADAVGRLVGTPPDVLVAQVFEASFYLRQIVRFEKTGRLVEERAGHVRHLATAALRFLHPACTVPTSTCRLLFTATI